MHFTMRLFLLLLGNGVFLGVYSHPRHTVDEHFDGQQFNPKAIDDLDLDVHKILKRNGSFVYPVAIDSADGIVELASNDKGAKKKDLERQMTGKSTSHNLFQRNKSFLVRSRT
jgi:hypothetical protein